MKFRLRTGETRKDGAGLLKNFSDVCKDLFHASLLSIFLMIMKRENRKNKKPFARKRDEELSPRYHPICRQKTADHFGLR